MINNFRIPGRISSKFSTAKLMALNETGIHNVVSLFITLSMTVDMGEMVMSVVWTSNEILLKTFAGSSHSKYFTSNSINQSDSAEASCTYPRLCVSLDIVHSEEDGRSHFHIENTGKHCLTSSRCWIRCNITNLSRRFQCHLLTVREFYFGRTSALRYTNAIRQFGFLLSNLLRRFLAGQISRHLFVFGTRNSVRSTERNVC